MPTLRLKKPSKPQKKWQAGDIDPATGKPVLLLSDQWDGWCIEGAMWEALTEADGDDADGPGHELYRDFMRGLKKILHGREGADCNITTAMLRLAAKYVVFK